MTRLRRGCRRGGSGWARMVRGPFVTSSRSLRSTRWHRRCAGARGLTASEAPGRARVPPRVPGQSRCGGARAAVVGGSSVLFALGSLCFLVAAVASQWASTSRPAVGVTLLRRLDASSPALPTCSTPRRSTSSAASCAKAPPLATGVLGTAADRLRWPRRCSWWDASSSTSARSRRCDTVSAQARAIAASGPRTPSGRSAFCSPAGSPTRRSATAGSACAVARCRGGSSHSTCWARSRLGVGGGRFAAGAPRAASRSAPVLPTPAQPLAGCAS